MDIFHQLAESNSPVIAILATLVLVLAGVVVYQQKYTRDCTVPKWLFDSLISTVNDMADRQKEMSIILTERLK